MPEPPKPAVRKRESVTPEVDPKSLTPPQQTSQREVRYIYRNRRAEMYGELRLLLNPVEELGAPNYTPAGFALPGEYAELRRQLSPIPLIYDGEGRLERPPKNKREGAGSRTSLQEMLGCSPDEADAR
jgi:hypothetical protein